MLMGVAILTRAQISPGDLTRAHAHLEGILSCTKCHVLGDKVSNDKCLDCHKEIKSRVDQKKGYHASSEVTGKDCFACHSDHHGRNFDIIRFDTEKFNHQLTGYKLTGAHQELDCRACHKDELIESSDLRKKEETYLGLRTDCAACHKDVHQKTLSTDCASCHNTASFAPAALFDHAKTDFPLKGKHKEVDCKRCHEVTFSNSALFQRFAGVPFNQCTACHEDVHNGNFGTNCKQCHSEESFSMAIGNNAFNHNQTGFPLIGKHRTLDCASCHDVGGRVQASNAFQDYKGKDFHACTVCHEDVHETKFGSDCRQCHSETSFQTLLNPDKFNHTLTGYVLEGKHATVDCRKCHETKMTEPLAHAQCIDCHDDYHKGQFIVNASPPDCRECHTVDDFSGSLYTIERHNTSPFPLVGAHIATPCIECHLEKEEWSFRNIGKRCVDCHVDVHEGFLSEKYYPQKACEQCHTPEVWAEVNFDHVRTGFELSGKHKSTSCNGCHVPEEPMEQGKKIVFTGLKTDCAGCHDNIHERQFEVEGITDCKRCHGVIAWKPSQFDHQTARFKLEGAHKNVECRECHKDELVEGKVVVKYRLEQFECASCHQERE